MPPVAAREIDEQLFCPGSWRALDAANQVVAGVRPGSLDHALSLVGRGPVASFFGRLRPGVRVIDVDMARGEAPTMDLIAWCVERGLWHVVRDSGQPGHRHVFVVVGDQLEDLERFAVELRDAYRVSRPKIDVRDAVRPLCAPHRSGATPPLPRLGRVRRSLAAALRGLPPLAEVLPRRTPRAGSAPVPLVPPAVVRRPLPKVWAAYLAEGVLPEQVRRWSDQSRSAVEATATFHMVIAGWSAEQAWLAIGTSHRLAMGKARSRGRAWWTVQVWNRAVADAASQPARPQVARSQRPPAEAESGGRASEVTEAVRALQTAFLAAWGRYGRDRRHTLRFVLDTVCERMVRTGSPVVPCPERDLVIDTGITSRRVLRDALSQLDAEGWLVLRRSFDPAQDSPEARSHHVSLPELTPSYPTPVGLPSPPSSFTPLPVGVRAALGPELWHTWCALPSATPADLAAVAARLGSPPDGGLSRDQIRPLLGRLQRLAVLGLAVCDEHGTWVRVEQAPERVLERAQESLAQRTAAVAAERAAYALVRAGQGRWTRQREQAIARWQTSRYLNARRWFDGLPAEERHARRSLYQSRFAALPADRQRQIKDDLARRRAAAGVVSEDAVRQAWITAMSPEQYTERVIDRTLAFRALPPPLQAAKAAAWADHRAQWGISRHPAPLPRPERTHRPGERAEALEQLDLLVLAESLDRDPHHELAGLSPPHHSEHRRRA